MPIDFILNSPSEIQLLTVSRKINDKNPIKKVFYSDLIEFYAIYVIFIMSLHYLLF